MSDAKPRAAILLACCFERIFHPCSICFIYWFWDLWFLAHWVTTPTRKSATLSEILSSASAKSMCTAVFITAPRILLSSEVIAPNGIWFSIKDSVCGSLINLLKTSLSFRFNLNNPLLSSGENFCKDDRCLITCRLDMLYFSLMMHKLKKPPFGGFFVVNFRYNDLPPPL